MRRNDSCVGGESPPTLVSPPLRLQSQRDHGRTTPVDYFQGALDDDGWGLITGERDDTCGF
jgi:hypothetical protein